MKPVKPTQQDLIATPKLSEEMNAKFTQAMDNFTMCVGDPSTRTVSSGYLRYLDLISSLQNGVIR